MRSYFRFLAASLLVIGCPAVLPAHDPGFSSSRVHLRAASVVAHVEFHNGDFARHLLPTADRDGDGYLNAAELVAARTASHAFFRAAASLRLDGDVATPTTVRVFLGEDDDVECELTYDRPSRTAATAWRVEVLRRLPRGHRQYATILVGDQPPVAEALLTAARPGLAADAGVDARPGVAARTVSFLWLGVEHILIGYDHILFLLALLLACRRPRDVAITISMFTLAHSVTFVAASLQLVDLPGMLVEASIAASIVVVGVRNLVRRGRPESAAPWLTTLVFGLLHGFGFASVLADLGMVETGSAASGALVSILAFNVGVELGQLAIAACVLPVLYYVGRRRALGSAVATWGSVSIVAAGTWWLVERTLLG